MSAEQVIEIGQGAVYTILLVSAPLLGMSLLVGLIVSVFQATTQIQEQTLAFIPKIIAVFVSVLVFGPWMLSRMVHFASNLLRNMHNMVG
ncbi:flagellar biosynthesis protein FliQ [Novibacillus thermophilus]|jgi:flagellar biosynthetic protein FliQ|uniref:Flagellar biosynthetic protein FliQ n=1 Tax=Novibacillus thermophilus TaxID=1471761 RepID=A0A1U9KA21_9BACL|nr:flagellar biosynthesis protein FliQ [Novibacillus thermophilus]AQS56878.1 flagellar biosynthetic protein FliQ [Novibacillus thermophilus]